MNETIDKQAQMPGESDRAYLAYTTYRDMPLPRVELEAYRLYLVAIKGGCLEQYRKVSSASNTFKGWNKEFNWAGRVKAWDDKKAERIRSAQIEADQQGYVRRIEESRAQLERTALMGMSAAELSLTIGYNELKKISRESDDSDEPIDKSSLHHLSVVTRQNKEAIDTLAAAKTEIYDALGLVETVEQLTAINTEG